MAGHGDNGGTMVVTSGSTLLTYVGASSDGCTRGLRRHQGGDVGQYAVVLLTYVGASSDGCTRGQRRHQGGDVQINRPTDRP
jgi:hypothetical protein